MTASASAAARPARLSLATKLFYGVGSVSFGVKDTGFSYLLLLFYNQVIGLSATAVGLAIMIAMFVDSFLDPIIGQISDNWRSRWGRRHPFMYVAALPVAVSYLAFWNPPHWSANHLFIYLTVVAIVIRSFISFYEVPSQALSAELTRDYDERTVLLSYRNFFAWIGGLVVYIVTLRALLIPDAHHAIGQLNPVGYARYGVLAAVIMFTAILVSALGTHRHIKTFVMPPQRRLGVMGTAREMLATWSHRSFLSLTLSGLMTSVSLGVTAAMSIYFNTYFWEFSADQISILAVGIFASAVIALIAAPSLSRRFGKRPAAMGLFILSFTSGVTPMLLRLMGLMPPNHSPALLAIILCQGVFTAAMSIAATTLVASMIADVVDDSELKTGRRSEGLFFSASSLVEKAVSGVGIFVASQLLDLIQFPKNAKPGQVPTDVIAHMALVYVPAIVVLYGVALFLLTGYKITRASHTETLRLLAAAEQANPSRAGL